MKVVPGQYLAPQIKQEGDEIITFTAGPGATVTTVLRQGVDVPMIVATKCGDMKTEGREILVLLTREQAGVVKTILPKEGDVVIVRITRTLAKQAWCELVSTRDSTNMLSDGGIGANGLIALDSVPPGAGAQPLLLLQAVALSAAFGATPRDLCELYRGVIRSQDIRSTDRDKVKVVELFRPGDIVRATIISLGDGNHYYLLTAANDLGVIFARSRGGAGDQMNPVDWEHMMDTRKGEVERRKVANPFRV